MIEELAQLVGIGVQDVDAAFLTKIEAGPIAQRRTSRNKAFVYVVGNEIVKGPYAADSLKLVNNLRYPYLLQRLEEMLCLPAAVRGVLSWEKLLSASTARGTAYYLAARNIGLPERVAAHRVSTQIDADFLVVERETFVKRVSAVEKQKRSTGFERRPDFDETIANASLQHLYLRYLLDIGDNGTHNILLREDRAVSGRLIAGIDFDEQRLPQPRRTALGYLFKQDQPYLEAVYGDALHGVVQVEALSAEFLTALDDLNAYCAAWLETLPPARRKQLATGITVSSGDILRRSGEWRGLAALAPRHGVRR